ncbi:Helix-turn-helix domain-containing protein [Haloechinothrix alba]|uniref:Helix-turn-helix domain-containing protein n=1 Tax=Haloechinothrix alba TaxID=664784 RepID=A0A238ZB66_9PSEU|nr:helix-turn-helix transcriptional regulator [Haloechinothrix alba]SNR80775.1 Helix-turn-helix domain-containing protein [Haloechinothrix alba]
MAEDFRPGVRVRRVARELRRWREQLNLTATEAAKLARWSPSKLSKVENAQQPIPGVDVLALAIVYEVDEAERDRLFRAALTASDPGWWQDYDEDALVSAAQDFVELESEATLLRTFKPDLVPGLLQTERYAMELARASLPRPSEETVRHRAEARTARQARISGENPLHVDAVIGEAALRQLVGGPTVMRAQLETLLERAAWPTITVRVLPLGIGAYPAMGSSFEMLSFAEEHYADVVYVENLLNGTYLEQPDEVEAYTQHFEGVRDCALGPEASAGRIREIITEPAP